jgi:hypothetical protein
MSERIEITNRYIALEIPYPNPETVYKGPCEGTGFVPIDSGELNPILKRLWSEAEEKEHSEDGWHFVKCPECGGTGKRR